MADLDQILEDLREAEITEIEFVRYCIQQFATQEIDPFLRQLPERPQEVLRRHLQHVAPNPDGIVAFGYTYLGTIGPVSNELWEKIQAWRQAADDRPSKSIGQLLEEALSSRRYNVSYSVQTPESDLATEINQEIDRDLQRAERVQAEREQALERAVAEAFRGFPAQRSWFDQEDPRLED